jgi:hypothetical protein
LKTAARTARGPGLSRKQLLRRALAVSGGLALGGGLDAQLLSEATAAPSPAQDVRILNFFLLLEYVEEGLYSEASGSSGLRGEPLEFARIAREHERAHVKLLERRLGDKAKPRPQLRFDDAVRDNRTFLARAIELEEAAAAAFIGEAANLTKRSIPDAARIVSVDARHSAWLRSIAGRLPAPRAADAAESASGVIKLVRSRGFVR